MRLSITPTKVIFLFILIAMSNPAFAKDKVQKVIIGFRHFMDAAAVTRAGGKVTRRLRFIKAVAATVSERALAALKKNPQVKYIELDRKVRALAEQIEWGVLKIEANKVWAKQLTGLNARVAVLDTGVDKTHIDLQLNLKGGQNFVPDKRGRVNINKWNDDHGHGSHVSGIVAASLNQIGVVGVAHHAGLYIGKVLNRFGEGDLSWVASGIAWAISSQVDVINMSLGWEGADSQAFHDAVIAAQTAGILVVVAAGNDALSGNNLQYPAAYPEVLAVGATDSNDIIANFSSFGYWVDVVAPGVSVRSTFKNGGYSTKDGTSMAAPHVAGIAALLKSAKPSLTASNIRNFIESTTQDLGITGWDQYYGVGRVNADKAVTAASGPAPAWDVAVSSIQAPETVQTNSSVNLSVKVSNNGTNNAMAIVTLKNKTTGITIGSQSVFIFAGGAIDVPNVWSVGTTTGTHTLEATATLSVEGATDSVSSNNTKSIPVTVNNPASDSYEPNNSIGAPYLINSMPATIEALINPAGDEDWYRIDNIKKKEQIKLNLTSLPADYDLFLYDDRGRLVKHSINAGTQNEVINYRVKADGTFFIRVMGYQNVFNTFDTYRLDIQK